jgi:hypothetical protein
LGHEVNQARFVTYLDGSSSPCAPRRRCAVAWRKAGDAAIWREPSGCCQCDAYSFEDLKGECCGVSDAPAAVPPICGAGARPWVRSRASSRPPAGPSTKVQAHVATGLSELAQAFHSGLAEESVDEIRHRPLHPGLALFRGRGRGGVLQEDDSFKKHGGDRCRWVSARLAALLVARPQRNDDVRHTPRRPAAGLSSPGAVTLVSILCRQTAHVPWHQRILKY